MILKFIHSALECQPKRKRERKELIFGAGLG